MEIPDFIRSIVVGTKARICIHVFCFFCSQCHLHVSNGCHSFKETVKINHCISVYCYSEVFFYGLIKKIDSTVYIGCIYSIAAVSRYIYIGISHYRGHCHFILSGVDGKKYDTVSSLSALSVSCILSYQKNIHHRTLHGSRSLGHFRTYRFKTSGNIPYSSYNHHKDYQDK